MVDLYGKDLITTQEWSMDEIEEVLRVAKRYKQIGRSGGRFPQVLAGKNFFMVFFAPSTRTRGAFEAGATLLGGHGVYVDVSTTRLGAGEAVKDVAKMYDIYAHGIGVRLLDKVIDFKYGTGNPVIREFARVAKKPVINMADDMFHPTQALGDIMVMQEKLKKLQGKKFVVMWAYSTKIRGPCSIHADLLIASRFGMDVVLAHPPGFELDPKIMEWVKQNAKESGGSFEVVHDYKEALKGAHAVFPRSWHTWQLGQVGLSQFGLERELEIHNKYRDWMLTQELVDDLMEPGAIVTHVLPVFRGEEATDEVMDGPNSVIYEQAEDNLYAKMAVMALTMNGDPGV